jgi:hypothetical protein
MSTSYSAALVYGLTFKDAVRLEDELGLESIKEMIYEGELDVFPPYYDAPYEDSIVGVAIVQTGSYNFTLADPSALKESNLEHMDAEGRRLEKLFGAENLKAYLTTVGS